MQVQPAYMLADGTPVDRNEFAGYTDEYVPWRVFVTTTGQYAWPVLPSVRDDGSPLEDGDTCWYFDYEARTHELAQFIWYGDGGAWVLR